jgi:hypothetical protein
MKYGITKNCMTNNRDDDRARGLQICAVHIESPSWLMSNIIPINRILQAQIHGSSPGIRYDLQTKIAQIANKDMFILGKYVNL